ncbi:hypothetical protein [uncultured Secundilactobacillus sp.]|uniref:hypothetical protein n=1 Tax=uncultured Secundilactobacillus sp. TaxID=2813935 RepID=UPI00258255A4|nr:hypothetical protein [uncultured Secundilactobacillus sp.]
MKQKTPGTTAYMWDAHHTRKLHNLKNYPSATWYLSKSVKMTRGGKSAIYYRLTSGGVSGYVWRGYLAKGINNISTGNTQSNGNSSNTIPNTDPSLIDSSLNNQLISMFPVTVQDSKLQKLANAYPSEKLSTSGYSSQADSSSSDNLVQTQLATSYVKIGPLITGNNVEPRKSFIAGTTSFTDYIKENASIYDGFNATHKKVNFSGYKGYHIGAYVSPKSVTSDPNTGTKGYGDFVVLLVK